MTLTNAINKIKSATNAGVKPATDIYEDTSITLVDAVGETAEATWDIITGDTSVYNAVVNFSITFDIGTETNIVTCDTSINDIIQMSEDGNLLAAVVDLDGNKVLFNVWLVQPETVKISAPSFSVGGTDYYLEGYEIEGTVVDSADTWIFSDSAYSS